MVCAVPGEPLGGGPCGTNSFWEVLQMPFFKSKLLALIDNLLNGAQSLRSTNWSEIGEAWQAFQDLGPYPGLTPEEDFRAWAVKLASVGDEVADLTTFTDLDDRAFQQLGIAAQDDAYWGPFYGVLMLVQAWNDKIVPVYDYANPQIVAVAEMSGLTAVDVVDNATFLLDVNDLLSEDAK
jgi:hypothetical protein